MLISLKWWELAQKKYIKRLLKIWIIANEWYITKVTHYDLDLLFQGQQMWNFIYIGNSDS